MIRGVSDPSRDEYGPVEPRDSPRLRRRLTLAFAGAVAVTALLLSVGSYAAMSALQDRAAIDTALSQARFNLFLADTLLPPSPLPEDYDALLAALAIRGDFETIIDAGSDTYRSSPRVTLDLVRSGLAEALTPGRLFYQEIVLADEPTLAVGAISAPSNASFFFLFPQGERRASLSGLRDILLVAGLTLAVIGTVVGYVLAHRTLRPISAARSAAARMAAGDLDVRLPTGTDEFGALAGSFNRMAQNLQIKIGDLEAARSRERRFVGDVTHELRTPVAALVGEASVLRTRLDDAGLHPETRRAAELLVQDVDRLKRLIEDLLEISRLDAGAEESRPEWFDLGTFIRQMATARGWPTTVLLRAPATPASPVEGDGPLWVSTDRRRLERIAANLVENALRHGAPPFSVDARVVPAPPGEADQLVLEVADHGPGIQPEHLPHVFERFYKADPSRTSSAGGGSGLGLSIAWENARLLGGILKVQSQPGEGTVFTLRVPLGDAIP